MRLPAILLLCALLAACGGGGGGKNKVYLTLSPHTLTLTQGASFHFSHTLAIENGDESMGGLRWTCTGGSVTNGTVADSSAGGIYTAPAVSGTYTVTVTSSYDTSKQDSATVTVIPPPTITRFSADSTDLDSATPSAVLTPEFQGGTGDIQPGIGAVTSGAPVTVHPSADTSYTLVVTNPAGVSISRRLDLKVWGVPQISFSAQRTALTQGDGTTLSWNVSGASTRALSPGTEGLAASGSVAVTPTATTTYTLTAGNPRHQAYAAVTVQVVPAAVITGWRAEPALVHPGGQAILRPTWTGGLATITPSVGAFASGDAIPVSPAATTTYTLQVVNALGQISQAQTTVTVASPGSFIALDNLRVPRIHPLMAPLPGNRVLVAGGYAPGSTGATPGPALASAEIVDLASGACRLLGAAMTAPRAGTDVRGWAVALASGKVLITGPTCEQFDPVSETFEALPGAFPDEPRQAAALADGRALVLGSALRVWDPSVSAWQEVALRRPRWGAALTALADGRLLIAGGDTESNGWGGTALAAQGSCEVFDPASGSTTLLPGVLSPNRMGAQGTLAADGAVHLWGDRFNAGSAVLRVDPATGAVDPGGQVSAPSSALAAVQGLADGRVLFLGFGAAQVFDPVSKAFHPAENDLRLWERTTFSAYPEFETAVRMPDGRVVMAGGYGNDSVRVTCFRPAAAFQSPYSAPLAVPAWPSACNLFAQADGSVLLFGQAGSWTCQPSTGVLTANAAGMAVPADRPSTRRLPDGSLLALGGQALNPTSHSLEGVDAIQRFDPATGLWSLLGHLPTLRGGENALLADGRVLLGAKVGTAMTFELFNPTTLVVSPVPGSPDLNPSQWNTSLALASGTDGTVWAAANGRLQAFHPGAWSWGSPRATGLQDAWNLGTAPAFLHVFADGGVLLGTGHGSSLLPALGGAFLPAPSGLATAETALLLADGSILARGWDAAGRPALALIDPDRHTGRPLPAPPRIDQWAQLADGRILLVSLAPEARIQLLDLGRLRP